MHQIACRLFIYAAPGATRRNWNEKSKSSTLRVQKSMGTPFPPHYTPADKSDANQQSSLA